MLDHRGIKARPHDLEAMLAHQPSLVELHCSVADLAWTPPGHYDVPLAVHVPEFHEGELLDPASLDEDTRQRAAAIYVQAAGRAAAWAPFFAGKPKVVFHPGGHTLEERPDGTRHELEEALGKTVAAMRAAAGDQAEVLIENLPASCWFFGGSWKARIMTSGLDLATFCHKHQIGCTLDLCHLYLAAAELRLDMVEEITVALPHVRHVHYSDARARDEVGRVVTEEGLQVGTGQMPLAEYFDVLQPLALLQKEQVYAVPEIWFGHEQGGAAFVEAWRRTAALLAAEAHVRG